MLVGVIEVDKKELEKHSHSIEEFLLYCDDLVPEYFRHQPGIVDNQRYLCCLYLRELTGISWNNKKSLLNEIMPTLSIVGYSNNLIEADTLFRMVNLSRIEKMAIKEGVVL